MSGIFYPFQLTLFLLKDACIFWPDHDHLQGLFNKFVDNVHKIV